MKHLKKLQRRRRRIDLRKLATAVGAAAVAGGVVAGGGVATAGVILTQDGDIPSNTAVDAFYGSNVTADNTDPNYSVYSGLDGIIGAPDIAVEFAPNNGEVADTFDHYTNWDGRGSVLQSEDDLGAGDGANLIVFTPSAGVQAYLVSVDMDAWAGGGDISVDWSVTGDLSGTLASGTWTMGTAGGRDEIVLDALGEVGEALTLTLDETSGVGSYFAIDNLNFDQIGQVPEPSTAALALIGGVGLAAMLRRRRR